MNTNKVIYSNGFLLNDKLSEILLPLPSHMQKNQKIKKKIYKNALYMYTTKRKIN